MPKHRIRKPDWTAVLKEYCRTGKVQQCPECGGKRIHAEKYYPANGRLCLWFTCSECNAWSGFFDGSCREDE